MSPHEMSVYIQRQRYFRRILCSCYDYVMHSSDKMVYVDISYGNLFILRSSE